MSVKRKFDMSLKTLSVFVGAVTLPLTGFIGIAAADEEPKGFPELAKLAFDRPFFDNWDVNFRNSLNLEHYSISGDSTLSPYQDRGMQNFDNFNLFMSQQPSQYEKLRVQIDGVYNLSKYRSDNIGIVPERLNFQYENGSIDVPLRVEVGDFFASFSPRTLQTSLKGAIVDFQPDLSVGPFGFYSIQALHGVIESSWIRAELTDNVYSGLSLLAEDSAYGDWSLNYVQNTFQPEAETGAPTQSQTVVSVAGDKKYSMLGQKLTLEGELAHMRGDHYAASSGVSGVDMDKIDSSQFLQLSGYNDTPFSYRFKYEKNGYDFRPRASTITPDRRAQEGYLTWRFDSGVRLTGRVLRYVDDFDQVDSLNTNTYGIRTSGSFDFLDDIWDKPVSGYVDLYRQTSRSTAATTNSRLFNFNANLNTELSGGWYGHFDLLLQTNENLITPSSDYSTRQVSFSGDHSVKYENWLGSMTPGLTLRSTKSSSSGTFDVIPTFSINAMNGAHSMDASLNFNSSNSRVSSGTDSFVRSVAVNYGYVSGSHDFRVEGDQTFTDNDPGATGAGTRFALVWTYNFNKPALTSEQKNARSEQAADQQMAATGSSEGAGFVEAIWPGMPLSAAEQILIRDHLVDPRRNGGLLVYETQQIDELQQRQRAIVSILGDKVKGSGMILEFNDTGNLDTVQQTFEKVHKIMIDRYGPPVTYIERGTFSTSIQTELRTGQFVRALEWQTSNGVIRFGIPRRSDGIVRMELRHASSLPPISNGLWGYNTIH